MYHLVGYFDRPRRFLVDCSQDTVLLKSVDASHAIGDTDALVYIFWTVCADYCINLILEILESMDHVKMVLDEAKTITRFLYSDELLLELMRKHIV
ncbi:uncharacterized protein M6B38_347045 [Iris pallida]|uniref:Uncharacterized protein n=1 Tax=Iris pallida TaxID=29817 RepID=A0AAX6GT30_IRIPA|nr:uncharacterized protein M6B38_394945 [Iris pallida]KAJ6831879.1 uncharacterized protein M6B38_347045 [Iris pallida]